MSGTDSATVLRSRSGVLTKRLRSTAAGWDIVPFSAGTWFSAHRRNIGSFDELAALLERVAADPRAGIVRGTLLAGTDPARCRRLSDRAEHGGAVTFRSCPRPWIALDIDGVSDPDCFPAYPEAGVEHVLEHLPEPFAGVSCWWQATGSAGIKPGIRCRLWFWLSRPVSDAEAKGWLRDAPVDRSLFTPVALHYTAAPILAPGTPNPVARRCGVRRGAVDTVEVPAELPKIETMPAATVALDGLEPTAADLTALASAVRRSRAVREIWTGERTFVDRSTRHFRLAAALARAGCRDADTIHRVLIACDQRHDADLSKILRADYARRTIGAALAAGSAR